MYNDWDYCYCEDSYSYVGEWPDHYCEPECSDYATYDDTTNTCYCPENGADYEWYYEEYSGHYCWLDCYGDYMETDDDECVCSYEAYWNEDD